MAEIETAALTCDADIEAWWAHDADVTGRLVAAVAVAAAAVPSLNARFNPEERRFEPLPTIDVGLLIETGDATACSVLCDVGHASMTDIRRRLNDLRTIVESCACPPGITLANFAHVPCRYAVLPVTPPQVAVVAAGQAFLHPVRDGGHVVHRHHLPLSLAFDVRACSAGSAARFLAAMTSDLAKPELPLARGWHTHEA